MKADDGVLTDEYSEERAEPYEPGRIGTLRAMTVDGIYSYRYRSDPASREQFGVTTMCVNDMFSMKEDLTESMEEYLLSEEYEGCEWDDIYAIHPQNRNSYAGGDICETCWIEYADVRVVGGRRGCAHPQTEVEV